MNQTKPFCISKNAVMAAWLKVRARRGGPGIDSKTIEDFESDLKDNLYKVWNRMSSGSYFPAPVMGVEIPKAGGQVRLLGVPTVEDRVAQAVVAQHMEEKVEPLFHSDSYGYRPNRSALEAVGIARQRCWRQDWVVDLDIKGFFDNLSHDLIMKAVKFHTDEKWVHLYVKRWLEASFQGPDGSQKERMKGTPQGGVVGPILSNIFMHYAFDMWMARTFPRSKFERYADDCLVHAHTLKEAQKVLSAIRLRLQECGLELHPEKTKIVYCKDEDRKGSYENQSFDFLGYTFRPRPSKNKYGKMFVNFTPAISTKATLKIKKEIRSWKIHLRSDKEITDLARMFNAKVQGWSNYYGRYYKSAMYPSIRNMERYLERWVMRKYKRFRGHKRMARAWLGKVRGRNPQMFVHWRMGLGSPVA